MMSSKNTYSNFEKLKRYFGLNYGKNKKGKKSFKLWLSSMGYKIEKVIVEENSVEILLEAD